MLKDDFKEQIENFLYERLDDKINYNYIEIEPEKLLSWSRLDLGFKIFYLKYKNKLPELSRSIYRSDIKAQTLGTYKEFGNDKKDSFTKYEECFEKIYLSIQSSGFNNKSTLIPLSQDGAILNGAHRVASSIHLNEKVGCIKTNLPSLICDYEYFLNRDVPKYMVESAVLEIIKYTSNTYVAFLWPSGSANFKTTLKEFDRIIYKKEIKFEYNGKFNLLYELYHHMDWIGDRNNNFLGINKKIIECFPNNMPIQVIFFQSDNLNKVREIKEKVRSICNLGFSSIHITDTKEESLRISNLLLNDNGIHFLKYAKPLKKKKVNDKINHIHDFIKRYNIETDKLLVDSSFILELYGLRESQDIDYILDDDVNIENKDSKMSCHDEVIVFYKKNKEEILYNPVNFFVYEGVKFISFSKLFEMKKCRDEKKDRIDCKMMSSFISDDKITLFLSKIKSQLSYSKIRLKNNLITGVLYILKKVKLYKLVRYIYRTVKRR